MATDRLKLQPIKIYGTQPDDEAVIVSRDDRLVAILLHLSHLHDDLEGRWFIEWWSQEETADHEPFETLDAARAWLSSQFLHTSVGLKPEARVRAA